MGRTIYEKLVKGYTEKQWNRDCKLWPPSIIKRLPVRFVYDNNYFNDRLQGIPIGGYTLLVERMLEGVEVRLNTDFFDKKEEYMNMAKKVCEDMAKLLWTEKTQINLKKKKDNKK